MRLHGCQLWLLCGGDFPGAGCSADSDCTGTPPTPNGTCTATTTGTSFCNTNPLLDPAGLADNGGLTQTIALEAGSPAINAGDETVCATPPISNLDQRGFVRPGIGAMNCSIGAYEFGSTTQGSTTTTTTATIATSTTTTTTSTILPSTTTTTTATCVTARCTLNAALMSPECAGEAVPASLTGKFNTAETLIEQAATTPGEQARKALKRAKVVLRKARAKATHAAKDKKATISSACAAVLEQAVNAVLSGLGS